MAFTHEQQDRRRETEHTAAVVDALELLERRTLDGLLRQGVVDDGDGDECERQVDLPWSEAFAGAHTRPEAQSPAEILRGDQIAVKAESDAPSEAMAILLTRMRRRRQAR